MRKKKITFSVSSNHLETGIKIKLLLQIAIELENVVNLYFFQTPQAYGKKGTKLFVHDYVTARTRIKSS